MTFMSHLPLQPRRIGTHGALLALLVLMGGCSTVDNFFQGDKVDYRSKASKTNTLEVPPDLTQLARDGRYAPQASGSISASTFQTGGAATGAAAVSSSVAPTTVGDVKVMRQGNQRWLVTPMPADKVWTIVRSFWEEQGFELAVSNADAGVVETNWAENRAKIGTDWFRRTVGVVLESLYATGERDKYRTRIERSNASNGTEIYLTHFGMQEVFTSPQNDRTAWTARPNDPQLEAEFLQRLMVRLGGTADDAKAKLAASTAAPGATPGAATAVRARLLTGQTTASLQVDENFDRAWRRVGQSLDRNGFTVEDRDRSAGVYFVRYADPRLAGKEEPGFFSRLFGSTPDGTPVRYRVSVKADGERSTVAVLSSQGGPENGEVGQRIVNLLLEDLR